MIADGRITVHPRACGELESPVLLIDLSSGSSPRMRGTRHCDPVVPGGSPVHPRACGELTPMQMSVAAAVGSSPRMRGTLHDPPGAGGQRPVHPRACGELKSNVGEERGVGGSSPRMRGTPQSALSWSLVLRFIPAHAGSSSELQSTSRGSTVHPRACGELLRKGAGTPVYAVHPRACGELFSPFYVSVFNYGSSPRMRGTQ